MGYLYTNTSFIQIIYISYLHIDNEVLIYSLLYTCNIYEHLTLSPNR